MRIKIALLMALLFLSLTPNLWAAPPQVVSSIPANGDLTADPWTFCIDVTFDQAMTGSYQLDYSTTLFDHGQYFWSEGNTRFKYCRNNIQSPLPVGSYWFKLNSRGHTNFRSTTTGEALPETTISFTVTADGSNNGDNTPPQISSSVPADGASGIDKTTKCLTLTFNEDMDQTATIAWKSSDQAALKWPDELTTTSTWESARKLKICRQDGGDLPAGDYTFTFNSADANSQNKFKDIAGNELPETSIMFKVDASAPTTFTYYVPYFTSANGYWSGLGISNNSNIDDASVSITPYKADGTMVSGNPNPPFTIVKNGQYAVSVADSLGATGWIKIDSSCELSGLCFLGSTLMADIPFVATLSEGLMIPHVAQTDKWDTKIMICNPYNVATSITMTYYSKAGNATTFTPNQAIPAMGSVAYDLSTSFNGMTLDGGKVKIVVTQGSEIAAFALYYDTNNGGSYFAGISADPITVARGATAQ